MTDYYPPGIPDDQFLRGAAPMTKAEVRAVTMSKARLRSGLRVLDIGAGTGSLTIEAALLCPGGEVVAIERNADAVELLQRNIAHFGVTNVTVIEGEAPDALGECLAPFARILLGGSGGRLRDLLLALPALLLPGGWVVANTIGLESTAEVFSALQHSPWVNREVVQLSVARGKQLGGITCFDPLTPVWITAAQLGSLI